MVTQSLKITLILPMMFKFHIYIIKRQTLQIRKNIRKLLFKEEILYE